MTAIPLPVPPRPERRPRTTSLHALVDEALDTGDTAVLATSTTWQPHDERDELLALSSLLDLHLAPLDRVGSRVRWQHHPDVARLKALLEERYLRRLGERSGARVGFVEGADAVAHVRGVAAVDLVPPVYEWLAEEATLSELRHFLTLEGGPDGGFDDFVALSQVGLSGEPKLELARNYWDEMGRGEATGVHTDLQLRMARAMQLEPVERTRQPVEALGRAVLGPVLATNRRLQPELIGALGLLELQAGPRCRKVTAALRRLGAPEDAVPFYDEHARTDPRHGKDWLDHVVTPLAGDRRWAAGMVRGAQWRSTVNGRFLEAVAAELGAS